MAGTGNSADAINELIWNYAWHYVNTCGGNKNAAFNKAKGDVKDSSRAYEFWRKHKTELEELVAKFRAENREKFSHIRDNNIAILSDIAATSTRNSDRVSAIKELNSMCGFNAQNVNVNGKVDGEIEVTISNL